MNPIAVALKGKGPHLLSRRAAGIVRAYGPSPQRMEHALRRFVAILQAFDCGATFPVVARVLARHPQVFQVYQEQGIEFAIHGDRHIDHCAQTQAEQMDELAAALRRFHQLGISAQGFRAPYLHANADTLAALRQLGLAYDSSAAVSWDRLQPTESPTYSQALDFYGAVSAGEYPSLPYLDGGLVRIPYSLPDDEALVHRLGGDTADPGLGPWLAVLRRSHQRGEIFTLGLHPERIDPCQAPLESVLSLARQLDPHVWIARLDEVAAWWQARAKAVIHIADVAPAAYEVTVAGPRGTAILAREIEVEAPATPWADAYQRVDGLAIKIRSPLRPFVGLSPGVDPKLASFVQQQGYIVETSDKAQDYECYLDQTSFTAQDQREVLTTLENTARALVRLSRWPDGAHSALAITGDIDALTMWDYALRLLGR